MADPIAVLVVEDDALIRSNIVTVLGEDGFNVFEAESSAVALATFCGNVGIQCLLTDMELGTGRDGLELASAVHDHWPDVGIIVVSAKNGTMPADIPEAQFFIKPYDPEKIVDMIRELVPTGAPQ